LAAGADWQMVEPVQQLQPEQANDDEFEISLRKIEEPSITKADMMWKPPVIPQNHQKLIHDLAKKEPLQLHKVKVPLGEEVSTALRANVQRRWFTTNETPLSSVAQAGKKRNERAVA